MSTVWFRSFKLDEWLSNHERIKVRRWAGSSGQAAVNLHRRLFTLKIDLADLIKLHYTWQVQKKIAMI
jgi:hypothetical protein